MPQTLRLIALFVVVAGCGSVTPISSDAGDGGGAARGEVAGDVAAADDKQDDKHDAGAELAADAGAVDPGTMPAQCPAFIPNYCHGDGGTAGGQHYGYCGICTDRKTDAAVTGCVLGGPGPSGVVCVASCSDCTP